jgi:NAD(P)-dependent dehydrogenase (short-subunit alcohol dehydrogenase family)
VASAAHRFSPLPSTEAYNSTPSTYDPHKAYAASKTANIHFTTALTRRYTSQNLHGIALHPGGIVTELARYMSASFLEAQTSTQHAKRNLKSVAQGAATTVYAAIAKELEGKGGVYVEDCGLWGQGGTLEDLYSRGWFPHAFDEGAEERLWRDSCAFVGVAVD